MEPSLWAPEPFPCSPRVLWSLLHLVRVSDALAFGFPGPRWTAPSYHALLASSAGGRERGTRVPDANGAAGGGQGVRGGG
jgi:hypothetical protein